MSQKSKKLSIIISLILTILLFASLIFLTYWLPNVVTSMIDTTDNVGNRENITQVGRTFVLVDAYGMVAVAYVAVTLIFLLLRSVFRGRVFEKVTFRLLSAISWCCFAEGVFMMLLVVYFQLAAGLAIGACMVGLCLRVVKNVIEEAARIKAENDFTI